MEQKGIKIIKESIIPLEHVAIVVPHEKNETTIICNQCKEICELEDTIHKETKDIYIFEVHNTDENELRQKLSFKTTLKKVDNNVVTLMFRKRSSDTNALLAVKYLKESFGLTLSSAKELIDKLQETNTIQCGLIPQCKDHRFIDDFIKAMNDINIEVTCCV